MKGFAFMLALASAAVLMICGPPALVSGENHIEMHSSAANALDGIDNTIFAEIPVAASDVGWVVHDPPSCSGNGILDDDLNSDKFTCNRRPARNILRQGVRLLNFLTC